MTTDSKTGIQEWKNPIYKYNFIDKIVSQIQKYVQCSKSSTKDCVPSKWYDGTPGTVVVRCNDSTYGVPEEEGWNAFITISSKKLQERPQSIKTYNLYYNSGMPNSEDEQISMKSTHNVWKTDIYIDTFRYKSP